MEIAKGLDRANGRQRADGVRHDANVRAAATGTLIGDSSSELNRAVFPEVPPEMDSEFWCNIPPPTAMSKNEKPNVLLVDDNEATCTLVTALLHREFSVETASDGIEALDRLKTNRYAVILLDLRMPQLDGFGVLDHLADTTPDVLPQVIVLTASLTSGEVARVKKYDVCGIVQKPFEVEELLSAVKRCATTDSDRTNLGEVICQSGPVILLIADLLRQFK